VEPKLLLINKSSNSVVAVPINIT